MPRPGRDLGSFEEKVEPLFREVSPPWSATYTVSQSQPGGARPFRNNWKLRGEKQRSPYFRQRVDFKGNVETKTPLK